MEVFVPKENNNDQVVMITQLYVAEGAYIEKGADLIEFETSKTAVVLASPASGYVSFLFGEESEVKVNSVVCTIEDAPPKSNSQDGGLISEGFVDNNVKGGVIFSNKAKQVNEVDVNIEGKFWVTSKMLTRVSSKTAPFVNGGQARSLTLKQDVLNTESVTKNASENDYELLKNSMRKRAEIKSLGVSGGGEFQSTIGIDINFGKRIIPSVLFDRSIQDLICFESSKMLGNKFSDLNGFYLSDSEIGRYKNVCAGISLDNLNKLTVARIENSDKKTLAELQDLIGTMAIKFEDGALSNNDLKGSTYTITDLSASGVTYMRPLLNGLESLIIGVVRRSEASFGLYVTFDHRVTEGLRVATFLDSLKSRIESHFFKPTSISGEECDFCLKSLEEELNLGRRGLLLMSTISGQKRICQNCYEGW